jgi:uncharacterized protein HemX
MSEASIVELLLAVAALVFAVLWYLLQQKDAKQQRDIELLWQRHDEDAKELQVLKLQIAQQHYVKTELDTKFDRMEETFRVGFRDLGQKVDAMTSAIMQQK